MENLVKNGVISYGQFKKPFERVNLLDAKAFNMNLPRWVKSLRLKEFQAIQGGNSRFFYNIAIFNAKMSGFVQIRVADFEKGKHYVIEKTVSPWKIPIADNILESVNSFADKDLRIHISNRLKDDKVVISFSGNTQENERIEGEFVAEINSISSLIVSIPFGSNTGMYAHKGVYSSKGTMNIQGDEYHLSENAFMLMDDHKGYYPYRLKWDWIAAVEQIGGKRVGISLTDNQSLDSDVYNENALWIEDELIRLPAIKFNRTKDCWEIRDVSGSIDLRFQTVFPKKVRVNLGPLGGSDYNGPFGKLSGKVKLSDGRSVQFSDAISFAESQYIRC